MAMREIPEAASRHRPSDNRGDGGGAMDVRGQLSWQIRRIHTGGEAARWARSGCLRAEPAGESQQAISNPRLPLPSRYLHPHIVEWLLSHTQARKEYLAFHHSRGELDVSFVLDDISK